MNHIACDDPKIEIVIITQDAHNVDIIATKNVENVPSCGAGKDPGYGSCFCEVGA